MSIKCNVKKSDKCLKLYFENTKSETTKKNTQTFHLGITDSKWIQRPLVVQNWRPNQISWH